MAIAAGSTVKGVGEGPPLAARAPAAACCALMRCGLTYVFTGRTWNMLKTPVPAGLSNTPTFAMGRILLNERPPPSRAVTMEGHDRKRVTCKSA